MAIFVDIERLQISTVVAQLPPRTGKRRFFGLLVDSQGLVVLIAPARLAALMTAGAELVLQVHAYPPGVMRNKDAFLCVTRSGPWVGCPEAPGVVAMALVELAGKKPELHGALDLIDDDCSDLEATQEGSLVVRFHTNRVHKDLGCAFYLSSARPHDAGLPVVEEIPGHADYAELVGIMDAEQRVIPRAAICRLAALAAAAS